MCILFMFAQESIARKLTFLKFHDFKAPSFLYFSKNTCIERGIRRRCPRPSQQFGICVFDPNRNCLRDRQCPRFQICCPDGCNRVCRFPV